MEITEELKKELGNAIAAYGMVLRKATLGIPTPEFEKLVDCSPAELTYRFKILKDFHAQL